MLYCDYDAYTKQGGLLSETEFNVWCVRASRMIDKLTWGRAAGALAAHPALQAPLADACAQMVDLVRAARSTGAAGAAARGLTSAATDGYSETYAPAGSQSAALGRSCRAVLAEALGADPYNLLYAGVCGC